MSNMLKNCTGEEQLQHDDNGFSLLELVVAVSIMLILAVVGFIAYQNLTDNAREAAVQSSAQQVLTAVIAANDSPEGKTPEDAVGEFNSSTYDVVANITDATEENITVTAEDKDGTIAALSAPGNYSNVATTAFTAPGVSYAWSGIPHRSESIKYQDGVEVARNLMSNPRIINYYSTNEIMADRDYAAWDDGYGVGIRPTSAQRGGIILDINQYIATDQHVAIAFDAQRVAPGGNMRIMLWNEQWSPDNAGNVGVARPASSNERERITQVLSPTRNTANWIYIEFLNNELEEGDLVGYLDKIHIAVADTEDEALAQVEQYFDGDSL